MKCKNYNESTIYEILNRTREISKDPYKLYVATVLFGLMDLAEDEDIKTPIGLNLPTKEVNDLIYECLEDFLSAIDTGAKVDVNGASYTIRNAKNVDKEKITDIFRFPDTNGVSTVSISGIFDVTSCEEGYDERMAESKDNISYIQKVIWLADKMVGGYDELTDIEVAIYCWELYFRKHCRSNEIKYYMFEEFYDKYKKYFYISSGEILKCVKDSIKNNYPQGYFDFSAKKIRDWNEKNHQKSIVDNVKNDVAEDYWYDQFTKKH